MKRRGLVLVIGILIALTILLVPLAGLSHEGKIFLALTLPTVFFWAMQIAPSGYLAGLYLSLLVILKVAPPDQVFSSWTGPTMYLIIGAYLIASAVKTSGLGERIAYAFVLKFVNSYPSIVISIFALTLVLSLLIPLPWPRAFLVMSVMTVVIRDAGLDKEDAAKIGFAVFAASVPVSLIFLTGDSVLNPLVIAASGATVGWVKWFIYMGIPAIIASVLTCLAILVLFKPKQKIIMDKDQIKKQLAAKGRFTNVEKRTVFWLVVAILLWTTDSVHGMNLGWITFIVAMLMSMPVLGEILGHQAWGEVPVHVLLFLTAAMAIGKIGGITGVNAWIAQTLLPSTPPGNIFVLTAFITGLSMVIHMLLGSVIAVMGVAIPALLAFTASSGITPLIPAMLVYTAISIHYVLPFHHLNILVGEGEENGGYSQRESLRMALPLTVIVFVITLLIELPWWRLLGLY